MSFHATGLPGSLSLSVSAADGTVSIQGDPGPNAGPLPIVLTASDGANNVSYPFDIWVELYGSSPRRGDLIITEVLYMQRGQSAGLQDEFIEVYNNTGDDINLNDYVMYEHSPREGTSEPPVGPFQFPTNDVNGEPSMLRSGEYAVVWMWQAGVPDTQQESLRYIANPFNPGFSTDLFDNPGDDIWLFDDNLNVVDYVAWNTGQPGSQVVTQPSPTLDIWSSADSNLGNAAPGSSIALAALPDGANDPACWEVTLSASATCGLVEGQTRDTDSTTRRASPGLPNW